MMQLEADIPTISAAAQHLRSESAAISSELESLTGALNSLAGRWGGDARDAYFQAQSDWLEATARMTAILEGVSSSLDSWAQRLNEIERDLASRWPS